MQKNIYLDGKTAEDFEFANVCTEIDGVDDLEEYLEVENCLHRLKFTNFEILTL